jgi:hypothetical protein
MIKQKPIRFVVHSLSHHQTRWDLHFRFPPKHCFPSVNILKSLSFLFILSDFILSTSSQFSLSLNTVIYGLALFSQSLPSVCGLKWHVLHIAQISAASVFSPNGHATIHSCLALANFLQQFLQL